MGCAYPVAMYVVVGDSERKALNPTLPDKRTIKRRLARLNNRRESLFALLNGTRLWQGTREVVTAATTESSKNAVQELHLRVAHAKEALTGIQDTLAEYDKLLEVMNG